MLNPVIAQEVPSNYAKKYELRQQLGDYTIISAKNKGYEVVILNKSGEKVAEFTEKKPLIFMLYDDTKSDNPSIYDSFKAVRCTLDVAKNVKI